MFYILDTDHYSNLERNAAAAQKFELRRTANAGDLFITVITVEEVMRGWIALLGACRTSEREISVYSRMQNSASQLGLWDIISYDTEATTILADLRKQRIRISTADLKIASIALAHEAVLLTRNTRHFGLVPGLKVENWLDD